MVMTLRKIRNIAAVFAAAGSSVLGNASAYAQDTPEHDSEIVVIGEAVQQETAIRDAVRAITPEMDGGDPLPRFLGPVCVSVVGLGEVHGTAVHSAIEANARAAGVEIARANCRANALVVVVDDPLGFIQAFRERDPKLFDAAINRRIAKSLDATDPAISWANFETRSKHGNPLPQSQAIPGLTGLMQVETKVNSQASPARVGLAFSEAIVNAVVVFDAEQAVGFELGQLADFATMKLLAPGVGEGENVSVLPPTILRLFENGEARPNGLTRFDSAYLAGLYGLRANSSASRLTSAVVRSYRDDALVAD